jgi:hypothetical protein
MMYSFAQRQDTHVVDEPLYGHYLKITGADHPGKNEIIEQMDCDGERVVREVILGDCNSSLKFFKNMAHHLVELDRSFLSQTLNILLTRDPNEVIPSLAMNIPSPRLQDTGYEVQVDLLALFIREGQQPIVLDSKQLLLDPSGVLEALCQRLGIQYFDAMLTWPEGPKAEDGIWAKHWYHNVHQSTEFAPYSQKDRAVEDRLKPLLNECKPYYEKLLKHAITSTNGK